MLREFIALAARRSALTASVAGVGARTQPCLRAKFTGHSPTSLHRTSRNSLGVDSDNQTASPEWVAGSTVNVYYQQYCQYHYRYCYRYHKLVSFNISIYDDDYGRTRCDIQFHSYLSSSYIYLIHKNNSTNRLLITVNNMCHITSAL